MTGFIALLGYIAAYMCFVEVNSYLALGWLLWRIAHMMGKIKE